MNEHEPLSVKQEEKTDLEPFYKLGGDDNDPTWEEYLDDIVDEYQRHFSVLRKFIEDEGLVGKCANEMEGLTFTFSDDICIVFTWRAWGDFMQAIVGKNEGYMKYYMKQE